MKKPSRLIFYLLINILVSAVTTLTVLWLWERAHPTPAVSPLPTTRPAAASATQTLDVQPAVTSTLQTGALPLLEESLDVQIRTVVGAGDLEMEYVEIVNQSEGAVDLSGWQLTGGAQAPFIFPVLILNQGGAIKVHSKTGQNTVIELYWQSEKAVWQSGDTVRLLDANGDLVTQYSIP